MSENVTQTKKFLDYEGVKYLWSKISMEDYPNNETLMDVIEAIDETKADKSELFSGSWNDLTDKPFIETIVTIEDTVTSGETAFADSGVGYLKNRVTKFHDDAYFIVRLLESGNEAKIDAIELWNAASGTITVGDLALQFVRKNNRKTRLYCYTITGYTGEMYISYNYPNGLKLDETYIPETIARLDDIPNAAGKKVEGTVYTVGTSSGSLSFTAGTGAEVFNVPAHGGTSNKAIGDYSHAEGYNTSAYGDYQHTQGKFNIDDTENKYAHIVGNGTNSTNRSNAHTIDWEGNAWYQGDVYVGSTSGTDKDEGSKKLATEEYVTSKIESMEVTPEDIIEWMTEEGTIVPLASTSGQVYATNDNKILII